MGSVGRVLMTADTIGGVFTYAIDLSRALGALGVEVVLATMGRWPTAEQRRQAATVDSLILVESPYKLEWMDEPWDDVARAGGWLLDLERRYAPDVVHLNGYVHAVLPFRAPCLVVGHSCVLSWWQAVKGEPAPSRYGRYRERVHAGLTHADLVVAPTCAMLGALSRYYGRLARAVSVPNGCDTALFAPREKHEIVAAAGRMWDEAKNLEALACAASTLSWPVKVAGEAEPPAHTNVARGREGTSLSLLGQLSRPALAELFGHAAIYAFPARYEPFGLSVVEAAASGAALVLSDIPSFRELWDGAALFVPAEDGAALAGAVECLIADASQRADLAQRSRARAQRFGLARFGRRYRELYEELVAARRLRTRRTEARGTPRSASSAT